MRSSDHVLVRLDPALGISGDQDSGGQVHVELEEQSVPPCGTARIARDVDAQPVGAAVLGGLDLPLRTVALVSGGAPGRELLGIGGGGANLLGRPVGGSLPGEAALARRAAPGRAR